MGVSIRNRQVHPATSSEFDETFRVCRACLAEYFAKKVFSISSYLHWYTAEILLPTLVIFCVFLHGKSFKRCRKTDETSLFLGQIINPMAYSDSSWKTASESFGVQNIPPSFSLTFSLTVCSSSHRKCMKISTGKNGMNQIWDICGFVERNLLYKMD